MIFRQFFDRLSCTYTYLLSAKKGRDALIIDPVKAHAHLYLSIINQLNLKLVASIDTHIHADHVTATGQLSQDTHCERVMGEKSQAEYLTLKLKDEECLDIDGIQLKAIYTPGHTDDSYCYLVDDYVFTGDTLFIRGTGRTDFQNGCPYAQYDSIFNKLLKLPEETKVYPGHDYKGLTVSTIWEEKKFNPRLQVSSKDAYAEIMNNLNLPRPKSMSVAVPLNKRSGFGEDGPEGDIPPGL